MKIKYLIAACLVGASITVGYIFFDPKPKLYNLTCKEYWDNFEAASKLTEEDKKKYFSDKLALWNYSVEKLYSENPEFKIPANERHLQTYESFDQNPYVAMFVMMGCEKRPGADINRLLGPSLKKLLFKGAHKKYRAHMAVKNGCRIYDGYRADLFDMREHLIFNVCGDKINSGYKRSTLKDDEGNYIGFQICMTSGNYENTCLTLDPNLENACLGTFGNCTKNENGGCGWEHTQESQNCLVSSD